MNHYLVSDLHLGHTEMSKHCNRPPNFEEKIIKNLSFMGCKDVLYNLGDLAFTGSEHWIEKYMNANEAKKILVLGNHDKHSLTRYYRMGFDFVCHEIVLRIFGKNILLSHIPKDVKDRRIDINIFGHFHNNPKERWEPYLVDRLCDKHKLLSIEEQDYRPVNLRKFISI